VRSTACRAVAARAVLGQFDSENLDRIQSLLDRCEIVPAADALATTGVACCTCYTCCRGVIGFIAASLP
jgi:hypothetical protein